jgi:hypothetical protein
VYWATENLHVTEEQAVHVPGVLVWRCLSSRGLKGPFFFEATVTGPAYLSLPQDNVVPSTNNLFLEKECYFQQDGAPWYYHSDVWNFLNVHFPGRWIGCRLRAEYPPQSPDLTPLNFYLWGTLKNTVYAETPEHCRTWDMKLKLPVLPFHYKQYNKYAILSHVIVNNALSLVVDVFELLRY